MKLVSGAAWLVGLLMVAALGLAVAAPTAAQEQKDDPALTKEAKRIDASASRADATRVSRRIAEEFATVKVKSSATDPGRPLTVQDVQNLRSKGLGYGEITILLALYSHQSGTTFQSIDEILAMKQSGQGWGQIAKGMGYESLGAVMRDVKRVARADLAKPARADRTEQWEKPEKSERPARPERPPR